jgi:hypothetical protein
MDFRNNNDREHDKKERFLSLVHALLHALETGETSDFIERDEFGNATVNKNFIRAYNELLDDTFAEELDNIRKIADEERLKVEIMITIARAEMQVAIEQRFEQCMQDIDERIHEIFKRHAEEEGIDYTPSKGDDYVYEDNTTFPSSPDREYLADLDRRIKEAQLRYEESKKRRWGEGWLISDIFRPK